METQPGTRPAHLTTFATLSSSVRNDVLIFLFIECKPAFQHDWDWRLSSAIRHLVREWGAPIIAWLVVAGMGLTLICVLFAPAE
jgi:hypothetical protein